MASPDCVVSTSSEPIDNTLAVIVFITGGSLTSAAGASVPALLATWATIPNIYITGIEFQFSNASGTASYVDSTANSTALSWNATDGIVAGSTYSVRYRATGNGVYGAWSNWVSVSVPSVSISTDTVNVAGTPSATIISSLAALASAGTATDAAVALAQADALAAQASAASALALASTTDASLIAEISDRTNGDATNAASIVALTITVNGNTSAISSEAITRANADSTIAGTVTTLTSTVGANTSAISNEAITRAAADSAASALITTLTSQVNSNTASISSNYTTLSTNISSTAATVVTLTSTVNANTAAISNEAVTRSTADSALSSTVSALTSTVGANSTNIYNESVTRAAADSALSSSITNLSSQFGYAANMVANSTFALGTVDWAVTSGAFSGGDGSNEGSFLLFNPSAHGASGLNYIAVAYQEVGSIAPGQSYCIQGRVYCGFIAASTTFARCTITWLDASNNPIGSTIVVWQANVLQGWTPFKVDSLNGPGVQVAPSGAATMQLVFDMASSAGDLVVNSDNMGVNQVQVQQGIFCTPWSDTRTSVALTASITSEQTTRATADAALSSSLTTLTSTVNGHTATLSVQGATLSTLQTQTASYLVQVATSGGTAYVELASTSGGITEVLLKAAKVYFGPNGYFNETDNTLEFNDGTLKTIYGQGFGSTPGMSQWQGPASIATSATTLANSVWAIIDGVAYQNSDTLAASGGTATNLGASTTVNSSAYQTLATATFNKGIPLGAFWQQISCHFTAGPSSVPSSGTTATFNWRILEAVHGSGSYSTVASGSFAGRYTSGEGWALGADLSTITGDISFGLQMQTACVNSGVVDIVLQIEFDSPSSITHLEASVGATWGSGG